MLNFTLQMEAAWTSETLVSDYTIKGHHDPELEIFAAVKISNLVINIFAFFIMVESCNTNF
jgi:hypothetical protein